MSNAVVDISKTMPAYIGIGGPNERSIITMVKIRGTNNVKIVKMPVIILASNIWVLVTGRVETKAEIRRVRSIYIWLTPIAQKPSMMMIANGMTGAMRSSQSIRVPC